MIQLSILAKLLICLAKLCLLARSRLKVSVPGTLFIEVLSIMNP
jgi:hypothetical protein